MTLRCITLATTILPLLTMGALAQTAAADRQPVQRPSPPTLQQELDGITASVTRSLTGLTNFVTAQSGQIAALQQQLAEAQQQIVTLTKERDDLKAKAVPAEPKKEAP
jgi:predicted RNase H-like nuclease (RuvC/YqgF family)